MKTVRVQNQTRALILPLQLKECSTFVSKFRGLMFKRELLPGEGIILVERAESIVSASIHMFFMNFDLAVIWLNAEKRVVTRAAAQKWKPYYAPESPARYTLEIHPSRLDEFHLDDQIVFHDED